MGLFGRARAATADQLTAFELIPPGLRLHRAAS
jgi:hypothetical protein